MENLRVGFIGGGNMASAIVGGVIRQKAFPAEHISGFDTHEDKR